MSNPQQNKIQNEIKQIKKEINLFEDKLKKNKKRQSISKWTKACRKNTNQKNTKYSKANRKNAEFFSNQTKYKIYYNRIIIINIRINIIITEYIAK